LGSQIESVEVLIFGVVIGCLPVDNRSAGGSQ
jgi:hypothetical protein